MKRAREDNVVGPQVKRPATSRGETSGPTQPPAGSQRLTTDDALAYLQAVKDIFKDKKEKYDEFLEVMKDFKAQRIDTAGVIGRVKELFKGHRDLILGFNTFLPKGYEITLPLEEEPPPKKQMVKQPVEFDQAINYVNKIKTRFQYDEQVYKAFLEILNMYRKGNKSINEVYQEVASLFCDHQDLLEEFTYFLPDSTGPAQIVHSSAPKASANSVPRREEKAPGLVVSRHTHLEKIVKKEKAVSIQPDHDRDRNSERAGEREQDRVVVKVEKEHKKKIEKEKEKKDERERKDKEERDSEQEREKELDAMQWLPHKRKSARRADELIRKQSQAGEGGETFAGPSAPTSSVEEKKFSKGLQKELIFFEKIKGRLRNRETYQEFLKCLNLYSAEIINRLELQSLVDDILGKYPELVEGFNDFLTHCENNEGYLANVVSKKFQLGNGPIVKPVKLEKEREKERDREKDKERDREKDRDRERDREKEREREKFTSHLPKDVPSHKVSMLSNKDKYMNKPISELDLSNCERCTPSYRLLPKNYPKPTASHRTDLAHAVINDNWVSVTSGSEDYSFKHMRKNQYEESLFRCEDDRFELDMLLESTAITAKRVEELLEKVHDANAPQELQIRVDDHLSAISLRCVERIYGDHGLDVIDLLRKNAALALPVILNRLRQKQEEWSKCRADMNKVWAEVYAKNYHKSLDHRSFYFKQQDKKSLSTKALLTEVKEINEKKRREDDVILSIAAGNRRPLISDLMFEYCDPTINEDLYKIIKYSSDEMCSTMEQSDKIMRIWTTFIEPIFGVPSRPHGAEDTEEVAKVKAPHAEGRGSSPGESDGSAGIEGQNVGFNQLGSSVELKHGVNSTDEVTAASSKVELETERAAAGIKAVANGQMVATILNDETKLEDGEQVDHKTDSILAGNLQLEKGPVSCAITSNSDLNGNGNVKRAIDTEGAATRPTPETLAGASTSRPYHVASDGRLEANSKERIVSGVEDVGRRRDNKTSESKLDRSPLKCGRVEVVQSGPLGRFEREEGELSPSPEVEERQNANYGSGENAITVTDNLVIGKIPKDTIPNKDSGNRQEDDDDVECDGDAEGEQDVDADDEGEESAPKTSEDSENVSEAGEEVSGSDSGDADDCSHEDNEEDDDDDEEEREGKAESEGEAEGMADAQDGEGEGTSLASSDRSLLSCKPLAAHGASIVSNSVPDKDSTVFYGNDTFYVLFRLHQTLYERVLSAKTNAMAAEQKWKTIKDTTPPDLYAKFMRVLYNLLDGSADNAKFEDDCRAIIGTQSYVLFTLDKLIFKLVKQLQAIASDEMANKLLALHSYEKSRAPGGFIDSVYHANTCVLLHDENIYRFEHRLNPNRLSIQLMDGGLEKHDIAANAIESSFSNYLSDFLLTVPDISERHPIFLTRNKQKYVDEDDYKAMVKVMRNVRVRNGLEYKISCNTCKVSYVLDTEDFLHRRKRKWWQSWPETGSSDQCEVAFVSSKRLLRFHRWVDEHADSKLERG